MGPLFDAWGIAYDPNQIVGDRELGLTVALRQGEQPSQHIAIIGFNRGSDELEGRRHLHARFDQYDDRRYAEEKGRRDDHVRTVDSIEHELDAVADVARHAMLADSQLAAGRIQGDRRALHDGRTCSRQAEIGIPERRADRRWPSNRRPRRSKETKGDANLIIVADTDILADPLWIRTQNVFGQRLAMAWANNGDFVSNSLDNLAGSSDLISIRGRQSFFRPFTRVDALRQRAGDQLRAKEQELDKELKDTESKLSQLEAGRNNQGSLVLSPEQEAELTRFQQERVRVRKELRDVRRSLDIDIERLGTVLKFWNILFIPILIAIGAIVLAATRSRKLKAGRAAAHTASRTSNRSAWRETIMTTASRVCTRQPDAALAALKLGSAGALHECICRPAMAFGPELRDPTLIARHRSS